MFLTIPKKKVKFFIKEDDFQEIPRFLICKHEMQACAHFVVKLTTTEIDIPHKHTHISQSSEFLVTFNFALSSVAEELTIYLLNF